MKENNNKKYLGIDWGEKRIGLATADSETKIAIPYKVISNIKELKQIIISEDIDIIVIGKPFKMKSKDLELNKNFLSFLEILKKELEKEKIKIKLVDERLSSKQADSLEGNKKNKAPRDAIAASIILEAYISSL